jgi:hypothetical protein
VLFYNLPLALHDETGMEHSMWTSNACLKDHLEQRTEPNSQSAFIQIIHKHYILQAIEIASIQRNFCNILVTKKQGEKCNLQLDNIF